MSRSTLIFLLKILVSLGLLVFLLNQIDLSRLLLVLSSTQLSYLMIALTGYILGQILCSIRWALLARSLGFQNPFKDFAVFYFIGMFFNLFAPSTVGGDLSRLFYLARDGTKRVRQEWAGPVMLALVSVLADRFIGLVVLVWMGAVALALFSNYALPFAIRAITFSLAAGSLLAWLFLPLCSRLVQRWDLPRGKNLLRGLEAATQSRQTIVPTVALSLFAHLIQVWMHLLLGRALEVQIPWSYALILYPLVGTFSALPVSFNGIGLREGGYLFLLGLIDIGSEKALAFGILWFALVVLDSLIGGVLFMVRKSSDLSAAVSEIKNQVR